MWRDEFGCVAGRSGPGIRWRCASAAHGAAGRVGGEGRVMAGPVWWPGVDGEWSRTDLHSVGAEGGRGRGWELGVGGVGPGVTLVGRGGWDGLASLAEGQVVTGYNLCIIHPNYCIIHLIHYSATCVYFSCVSVRVHVCVCVFCMFILVFLVVFYVHFSTLTMFYDHFCIFNWFYGHFTFLYSSYFLFLFILMLIQSKHYFYIFFLNFI